MASRRPAPLSRREFVAAAARTGAVSALAGVALPAVHAAQDSTLRIALVGCGGRGTGAVVDAISVPGGPVKLVAMADVFEARLADSHRSLNEAFKDHVDVPPDRRFVGFDAYKRAMDLLRPGDVVILATPPAFRWPHFGYAIEKSLNVFMEKPTTVDGPSTRRMLALADASAAKGLKVGVGLMCRHCAARTALHQRIRDGAAGDIMLMRAYRMHDLVGYFNSEPPTPGANELLYQVQRFHSFLWASGGAFSDFYIHCIDECCWMKDAWPVRAQGLGGRHYRGNSIDQNFDTYSIEYTFADGATLLMDGRCMPGCHQEFASYAHGTRGLAIVADVGWSPARCRIYKGQARSPGALVWEFGKPEPNPYRAEWEHLLAAIRNNTPYNEARRGAEASLVSNMGRMAAHTGQVVTFEQALNHDHEMAPAIDTMTAATQAPVRPGSDGTYPVPQPGRVANREY